MKLFRGQVVAATILGLSVWGAMPVGAHEMPSMKPASAQFDQVKQLAGKWSGKSDTPMHSGEPDTINVEFKLTAAGSAVEEHLMEGSPSEMVDMYTDENGKLAMTHYCAMGNQPHMVLKNSDAHSITLEMGPTAGIDSSKDVHMHRLVLEFLDSNHLRERWTNYHDGKEGETVVFNLTRV